MNRPCTGVIIAFTMLSPEASFAQTPSPNVSAAEMSACRGDAIRLCFFSIAQADALRDCLRHNKPGLSQSCRKLGLGLECQGCPVS
jgi:hypothetical protein